MRKDLFSDLKITEAYEMFGGPQTDTIHFRCTPKFKEFIEEMGATEGKNVKDYLIKLVMEDYEAKYKNELEKLREETKKLVEE